MINTYLDIAINHLSYATTLMLSGNDEGRKGWPALSIGEYEYGFFVTVPPSDIDAAGNATEFTSWSEMPRDLEKVFRFAQKVGVMLIRFDSHAEEIEEIPAFNW